MSQDGGQSSSGSRSFHFDHDNMMIVLNTITLSTECPRCCRQFHKNDLDDHKQSRVCCTMWKFYCEVKGCREVFIDRDDLLRHLETSHEYRYTCSNFTPCEKIYKNYINLQKHQHDPTKKCSSVTPTPKKTTTTSTQPSTPSTQPAATNMDYLLDNTLEAKSQDGGQTSSGSNSFRFDHRAKLMVVDTVTLPMECPHCCCQFDLSEIYEHKTYSVCSTMHKLYCEVKDCEEAFMDRDKLFKHLQTYHGYRYACNDYFKCERHYKIRSSLIYHQNDTTKTCVSVEGSPKNTTATFSQPTETSTQPAATNMDYLPDGTFYTGGSMEYQPPANQPPANQPLACQLPAYQPTASELHSSQPPEGLPLPSQLPASQWPTTQPSAGELSANQPPPSQPPADQLLPSQPPAEHRPAYQWPTTQSPAGQLPPIQLPAGQLPPNQLLPSQPLAPQQPLRETFSVGRPSANRLPESERLDGLPFECRRCNRSFLTRLQVLEHMFDHLPFDS